jgi:hypothetical protein
MILHVEADVVEDVPFVGACALSALAKRICTPGMSTTGALLRVPAFPPNVFAYQACALGISASVSDIVDMLVADRHRLRLVFQDFHAHAVRRFDIGLVKPSIPPGSTFTPLAFHSATRFCTLSTMKPTWFTTVPWVPPSPLAFPKPD